MLATTATTTSLTVSSGGSVVTSIAAGTVVTLTATVAAGGVAVNPGQVRFCDAAAAHCMDNHLLGVAQLTSSGTAVYKFFPGIGSHSYKAEFLGTTGDLASNSVTSSLTVTGTFPTAATVASTGTVGNYSLTGTVVATGGVLPLAGTVSFVDTTNANNLLGTASLGPVTTGLNFSATSTPVGNTAVVGDFNGDGRPDLIANGTVQLGNGDGTFTAVAQGAGTIAAAVVGDFNGDGKLDVASGAGVLLGNGDGTFTAAPGTFPTVYEAGTTIAGDFNGDGNEDLAILMTPYGNPFNVKVVILLGNGDGTFTASPTSYAAGSHSTFMVAGDFNGDGKIDLAVAGSDFSTLPILLGNGDGTFTEAPMAAVRTYYLGAGDFNGDGITDLVSGSGVYLSNGDGTFAAAIPIGPISDSFFVTGDFNGDGKLDVASAGAGNTQYSVNLALGRGDGSFSSLTGTNAAQNSSFLAVGDFNGDGYPDLAIGNQIGFVQNGGMLTVVLTKPTSTANATASSISPVGAGTHQVEANYAGSSNYGSSSSTLVGLSAQIAATALVLSANPSGSSYGQQVVLSASLTPYTAQGLSTNGEAVTFSSGGLSLGTGVLSSGVATLNVTLLSSGVDSLQAFYGGDTNFGTSTSNTLPYGVTGTPPTITFAVGSHTFGDAPFAIAATSNSTGSISYSVLSGPATVSGSTVTVTGAGTVVLQASEAAAVSYAAGVAQASFVVAPSAQTISFAPFASPVSYGASPIMLGGSASSGLPVSFSVVSGPGSISGTTLTITGAGSVVIAANQAGNGNYLAAAQVTQTLGVSAAVPLLAWASPAPITYGSTLAGVLGASASSGSGSVAGSYAYANGATTVVPTTVLPAGSYTLSVTFTPTDGVRYTTATGTVMLTVNKGAASVALTSGANPAFVNNTVGFSVAVASTASTPTGSVTFLDGGVALGSATLTNGTAALSVSLSAGSHTITATYSGDANFSGSGSAAVAESIQDFSVGGGTTTAQTVAAGGTANYSLTLTPVDGTTFPAALTLAASGLPLGSTATITPLTIAAGAGTTVVALGIQTAAKSARLGHGLKAGGATLALLLPFSLALIPRRRRRVCLTGGLLAVGICGGIAGCSGGGGGGGSTPAPVQPQSQTYTVTVTATSGSLSHATTLTLTVQ